MLRSPLVLLSALGLLAFATVATASERHPTLRELETQIVCPTCETTLDQSDAPVAQRIRAYIQKRIAAGASESRIKNELVAQFGPSILANPPQQGWGLVAWLLPIGAALAGLAGLVVAARHWRRRPAAPAAPLDPEVERLLDEELARFEG